MTPENLLKMMDLIRGYEKSQVVCALASLSIADILAEGPAPLARLIEKTGAHPDALKRLIRGAASIGLVRVEEGDLLASTPALDCLREDAPVSLRAMAIAWCSAGHWQPWGRFCEAVRTGEPQSVATLGRSSFEHFAANPEEAAAFSKAMQATTETVQAEVVRLVETDDASTIADIGGANGALACAFVAAKPRLKGIVFDLPHTFEQALAYIRMRGLADKVTPISGDFFDAVPAADLYLMKFILHDWDDDACVRLLKNCRRAMNERGRIVVVELRLGAMGDTGPGPLTDLIMLVSSGGRERTADEYGALFSAAGLNLVSVKETSTPFSIFEAVAA